MEIKDIRPIPKHILKEIQKQDKIEHPERNGQTRFYRYYTQYKRESCEVIVAVRNYYKRWFCKQVVVHGINTDKVYLQDIARYMGFLKVGWYRDGISKYERWHDYDWGYNDEKYFHIPCTLINKNYILTIPKFKYSAIDKYEYTDIMKYLRLYLQYPKTELLVKAGLSKFATSKQILRQCNKDKKFCKWLFTHKEELEHNYYYTSSIIKAYKQNKPIKVVYNYDEFKKTFYHEDNFILIKAMLHKGEFDKFERYIVKQSISAYLYDDYLRACTNLGLDMDEEKNRYPKNFQRWHDIRIDQYRTKLAEEDKKKRKELYKKFQKVAKKYDLLERNLGKDDFICIIAKSPQDLINEGEVLNHCVGRMNYDQKFAREESLIFFIRNKLEPDTPFVTLEYSIKDHKVLQCYGEHDSKPNDQTLNFVNKVWLPYANRKIKNIAA